MTNASMATTSIPADAVRCALISAIVKKTTAGREIQGIPLARTAAFTRYESFTSVSCRNAQRGPRLQHIQTAHFGPVNRGDLDRLVRTVHLYRGAAEVRKTWGCSMRALHEEIGNGVLR